MSSQRVISLVPSLTETLLALGITPIACTRFCEQPSLVHVGGTKDPDVPAIIELRPDVVLMDREENRREDAEALTEAGVNVVSTHVTSVGDVAEVLADLVRQFDIEQLPPDRSGNPPVATPLRRAFIPIWRRPWMTLSEGTYGSSLLAWIGIVNVFAGHPMTYPTVQLDDVALAKPDLVLLPSEPYPFKTRHADEISSVVPGAEIRFIDGQDLFWWGVRTRGAAQRLAQTLDCSSP